MAEQRRPLQDSLLELEVQVAKLLASTPRKGATVLRDVQAICDSSVQHARQKQKLLRRHCSSLALTALEHAREEISQLSKGGNSEEELEDELDLESEEEAGEGAEAEQACPSAAAAAAVAPLRSLVEEAAEAARERKGPSLRELSSSLPQSRRSLEAAAYDFELAPSLSAGYYMTEDDFNPFRRPASISASASSQSSYSRGSSMSAADFLYSRGSSLTSAEVSAALLAGGGAAAQGGAVPGPPPFATAAAQGGGGGEGGWAGSPRKQGAAASEGQSCPETPVARGDLPALQALQADAGEWGVEEGAYLGGMTPPKAVLQRLARRLKNMSM